MFCVAGYDKSVTLPDHIGLITHHSFHLSKWLRAEPREYQTRPTWPTRFKKTPGLHTCAHPALFTIAKGGNDPQIHPSGEWINKLSDIHIMNYYSVLERKEALTHGPTWMNLADMMQSEVSQTRKSEQALHDSTSGWHLE